MNVLLKDITATSMQHVTILLDRLAAIVKMATTETELHVKVNEEADMQ